MLKKISRRKGKASGGRFAIVASKYNRRFVDSMVKAAEAELKEAGAEGVQVIRVPGAFEIPAVASALAAMTDPGFDAIICLGVIIRGATSHADHIGSAVTSALVDLQVQRRKPMIHEVLVVADRAQARARCLDAENNRGSEAAQTALEMARVMASLA